MQIRHLRQQVPQFHVVARSHRQRIQRPIRRRRNSPVVHLVFERRHFAQSLLHLQLSALRAQHGPTIQSPHVRAAELAVGSQFLRYRKEAADDAWKELQAWFKKYNVLS